MSDKELLEQAAKAAGFTIVGWVQEYDVLRGDPLSDVGGPVIGDPAFGKIAVSSGKPWNPLLDDGDALRLAVKLCMNIEITESDVYACCQGNFSEPAKPDREAATRRAVVRAAAEIGKSKP
ncbi:hypothetical protein GLGCALEP_02128 [Pseudomonas sp. MM221]|nr:hypothetical protein DBADOPDK_02074 [Pseudomonas sp. MM223]CAI3799038.1 hypothetical protein GLGCALEP_02128 [Pseudomonas sp. MM221]